MKAQVGIRPVLLGGGLRFLEHVAAEPIELEPIQVIELPGVTYLRFRFVK